MYLAADMVSLCPGTYKRDQSSLTPKVAPPDSMTENIFHSTKPRIPCPFFFIVVYANDVSL